MWTRKSKRHLRNRGHAMVEFLLSIICLMIAIMWILQFMLLIYNYVLLAGAAKEGVRYAVVHGAKNASPSSPADTTNVVNAAKIFAGFDGTNCATGKPCITVTYPDGSNALNNRVRVTISYPFVSLFSFGWTPPTINAAAQGRIMY
jgi:Flp pilus assembly protein TadG